MIRLLAVALTLALWAAPAQAATLTMKRAVSMADDYVTEQAIIAAFSTPDISLIDAPLVKAKDCYRINARAVACDYDISAYAGKHLIWRRPGVVEVGLVRGRVRAYERRFIKLTPRAQPPSRTTEPPTNTRHKAGLASSR